MKKRYIIYAILIIVLASLVAYRIIKNNSRKEKSARSTFSSGGTMPPMRVNGVVVKPQNFANSISVSGTIEANEQVDIRAEVPGIVTSIRFQEGSNVKKGQLLLKINDRELKAQLSQALTKQKLAEGTEYRAEMLLKKEAISKEEYDIALADLQTARAQTQLIRAQLSKTSVTAPFSGRIGLRSISTGEYITPATAVARLVNLNPVKVSFSIPEKYAGSVKVNTELTFNISGSAKVYSGRVYAIEPGIEASTRTLQFRARSANPNGELLPGTFAKINLPLSTVTDAILIPTEAIIPIQNGKKVFVTDSGKAKEVVVETSTRTDKDVLIISGLTAGDTVLTTGIMALKSGTPVKVSVRESN